MYLDPNVDHGAVQLVDVNNICNCLVDEKKATLADKARVNLSFEKHETWSTEVRAYVNLDIFPRIISNLINNAVEAISDSGKIIVNVLSQNGSVVVSIEDTGVGITQEEITKIFSGKFSSRKKNGLGIGLFYARKHLEKWGGSLRIDSRPGKGTIVSVVLNGSDLGNDSKNFDLL